MGWEANRPVDEGLGLCQTPKVQVGSSVFSAARIYPHPDMPTVLRKIRYNIRRVLLCPFRCTILVIACDGCGGGGGRRSRSRRGEPCPVLVWPSYVVGELTYARTRAAVAFLPRTSYTTYVVLISTRTEYMHRICLPSTCFRCTPSLPALPPPPLGSLSSRQLTRGANPAPLRSHTRIPVFLFLDVAHD